MNKPKVVVVGELHQDIFYQTSFFSELASTLALKLKSEEFIKNMKSLNLEQLTNEVLKIIGDFPKKYPGDLYIKRGGNGNNSANMLALLSVPIRLMTTIGAGAEWMIPELNKLGIDTSTIFQVNEQGPISTIVEDPNITKIFVAPNLKSKMNFESVEIKPEHFKDAKIVFFTPIADKYADILRLVKSKKKDVITAITIETQKIQNKEELRKAVPVSADILFANLNDVAQIIGLPIQNNDKDTIENRLNLVDNEYKNIAACRVYTLGKYGSWICIGDFSPINIPIIQTVVKNRTGAGDTYAAAFIAYLYRNIRNRDELNNMNLNNKKELFIGCGKYATAAASLKVKTGDTPKGKDVDAYYNEQYKN